jgi:hypothetical protein
MKKIKYTLNERKAEAMIMYLKNKDIKYKYIPSIIFISDVLHLNKYHRPVNAEIPKYIFKKFKNIKNKPDMDLLSKSDIDILEFARNIVPYFIKKVKIKYDYYKMLDMDNIIGADDIFCESEHLCF